jgi:hypothetical protein
MPSVRGTLRIAAAVAVCAVIYVVFLTAPVLSKWSGVNWLIIGVLAALVVGALFRLSINKALTIVLNAVGGVIVGALWTELRFGQHDTSPFSWWSTIQSAIGGTWLYAVAGVLMFFVGWYAANIMATKAAQHALERTGERRGRSAASR